ncbi:hypothetical protein V4762_08960 [Thermodesulfobium sp. 4217-1]|uniref:hypothetical protein n=1 Tax=Thermodesulfobium sp. 4217-1 TaxID=3120013 RepID=UPI0032219D7B
MVIKTEKLKKALLAKGFFSREGDHTYFYLKHNSKIYTKISHGAKEYGDALLSKIKNQLKFNSLDELKSFSECTLKEKDYIEILKDKEL